MNSAKLKEAGAIKLPEMNGFTPVVNPRIQELENRSRQRAVPLHEIDNGAKCLECEDACPGLDLHFWRKTCKECLCKRDVHDVKPATCDPGEIRIGRLFDNVARFNPKQLNAQSSEQSQSSAVRHHPSSGPFHTNSSGKSAPAVPPKPGVKWNDQLVTKNGPSGDFSGASGTEISGVAPPNNTGDLIYALRNLTEPVAQKFLEQVPKELTDPDDRSKRLIYQIPDHDLVFDPSTQGVEPEVRQTHENFISKMKDKAVGVGEVDELETTSCTVTTKFAEVVHQNGTTTTNAGESSEQQFNCTECHEPMKRGDIAVFAERAGKGVCWHPQCFKCSKCKELLADLLYFFLRDKIYCGRHFGELKFNRCNGCDELIFAKVYTGIPIDERGGKDDADNKIFYHFNHFCCYYCDIPLGGQRYWLKKSLAEPQPVCLPCYTDKEARTCFACNNKIGADVTKLSFPEDNPIYHYHSAPECFCCMTCSKPMLGKTLIMKAGHIFCSKECKPQSNHKRTDS